MGQQPWFFSKIPCKIVTNIEKIISKDNKEDNEKYGKDKEEISFDKGADIALNSDVNLVIENGGWYDDQDFMGVKQNLECSENKRNHIDSVNETDHGKIMCCH